MSPPEDVWADKADEFVYHHYQSIRGRVRTHVVDAHLREFLTPPPGSIVDIGGGAGTQSIPLARRGYEVTILDVSPTMLDRAARALDAEPDEDTAGRVTLVHGEGADAITTLGATRHDGVLCHAVLPYLDNPEPVVANLCELAAPGGIVSIIAKNRKNLAVLPALNGRWDEALESFGGEFQVNGLGLQTRADTIEGLSDLLRRNGVEPLKWFGVRLFTDGWNDDEPEPSDVAKVYAVELEASHRDPYRQMSRLFHLIGRKL